MRLKLSAEDDDGLSIATDLPHCPQRPIRPQEEDLESVRVYAQRTFGNGLGYFAHMQDDETRAAGASQMREEIHWLAGRAEHFQDAELYVSVASAWRSFSTFYCHVRKDEDKGPALRQAVAMYEKALELQPHNTHFLSRLARLLCGTSPVQDVARARELGRHVLAKGPDSLMQAMIDELDRKAGHVKLNTDFAYHEMRYVPFSLFTIEQKKCRELLRQAKRSGDIGEMIPALEHMYRLSLIYECAREVDLQKYQDPIASAENMGKLRRAAEHVRQYSYPSDGRVAGRSEKLAFISPTDYRYFIAAYGITDKIINPMSLIE